MPLSFANPEHLHQVLHLFKFFAARGDFTALVERASKPAPILVTAPPLCGPANPGCRRLLAGACRVRGISFSSKKPPEGGCGQNCPPHGTHADARSRQTVRTAGASTAPPAQMLPSNTEGRGRIAAAPSRVLSVAPAAGLRARPARPAIADKTAPSIPASPGPAPATCSLIPTRPRLPAARGATRKRLRRWPAAPARFRRRSGPPVP